ncbi:MAG: hypothetical protein E4H36_06210, partial [Spirochaetales bacterium]
MKRKSLYLSACILLTLILAVLFTGCPLPPAVPADSGVDTSLLPAHKAAGAGFTDIDPGPGEIAGSLSIQKAADESDITQYVLYWGSGAAEKLTGGEEITAIGKTSGNLDFFIPPDSAIPSGASYLLVYSKNEAGEMAEPLSLAITDAADTVYTGSEGTAASPIVLASSFGISTYSREIGQGRSYYSLTQTNNSCTITITDLTDDIDLIFYTDSSYTTVDTVRTRYYG